MYDFKREFERQLKILKKQIQNTKDDLEILKRELLETETPYKRDELKELIFSKERFVYMCKRELEFLRPGSVEDYEYRYNVLATFFDAITKVLPRNIHFRFHGTSIYFAKEIIESGEISPSQDRLGFATSNDSPGFISVTTIDNISWTIGDHISLTDFCMPAGCVFVLLPTDKGWEIIEECQMKKVDFRKNPSVLFAILTTPENVPRVREWCKASCVDESKVYDFLGFLDLNFDKDSAKKLTFSDIDV